MPDHDSTTNRAETLDDWLEQWRTHGGWQARKAEVQRLVDEIERLRTDRRRFRPAWAVHPGEILREEIGERGMTQTELAGAMEHSIKHVNEVIKGHVRIEVPFALRLEKILGASAELWLNLQQAHDLHRARSEPPDA